MAPASALQVGVLPIFGGPKNSIVPFMVKVNFDVRKFIFCGKRDSLEVKSEINAKFRELRWENNVGEFERVN
jgi:hypothetical protein